MATWGSSKGASDALRHVQRLRVDGERVGLDTPVTERSRLDVIAAISGG